MNNKIIGIFISVIVIFGIILVVKKNDTSSVVPVTSISPVPSISVSPSTPVTSVPSASPVSTVKTYSLSDIAMHPDINSCWSAVNGKVYDLTSFIPKHPGGPKRILAICGKDGSSSFANQHEGEPKPAQLLASFYIGELK